MLFGLTPTSARLASRMVFHGKQFDTIGRDALQVGHATRVRVEQTPESTSAIRWKSSTSKIRESPVAIDTAGNVDHSEYACNTFDEVNGQCIDLDGFHDGLVRDNSCTNRKGAADYPFGSFGIVMNNANPDTHSE